MKWNSNLYNTNHDFIAKYGEDLLQYVPQHNNQTILDLGCGTGTLTAELANLCSYVLGIDSSPEMIAQASHHYPQIDFRVGDALNLNFEKEWDVIFSNAVFHWISDHNLLIQNIYQGLKPEGILICEFGANGNISAIETAFATTLESFGYLYQPKFNFPTLDYFKKLLTNNGLVIDEIYEFDRPTILKEDRHGLRNWIKQFFALELATIPDTDQLNILSHVENLAQSKLWTGKEWIADYRRLRVIAHKQGDISLT